MHVVPGKSHEYKTYLITLTVIGSSSHVPDALPRGPAPHLTRPPAGVVAQGGTGHVSLHTGGRGTYEQGVLYESHIFNPN